MTLIEALGVLRERAAYLTERVRAKQNVGWSWEYDERERAALEMVIAEAERGLTNGGTA